MILYQDCQAVMICQKTWPLGGRAYFLYIYLYRKLLVGNHLTDFIITWQKSFLVDPLPRLFKLSWFAKNHGRQGVGLIITKTCLYIFDPLKPHFYIVKLGFTGVYIIFLIFAQNIDCGFLLEPPGQGSSNAYPQSMFWAKVWKISEFFIWNFSIFGGEIFYIFE